jgi:mitochondrial enoyl-[acyl-carrier protein] reductase / trans-2-enoyl-CoA reductase
MSHSRAVRFETAGDPGEVLSLVDVKLDPPAVGRVRVEMEAAPLDPSDLNFVRGRYGIQPAVPSGVGQSGVGHITAIGSGVGQYRVGDRVMIIPTSEQFVWAEQVDVAAENLVGVDGDADPVQLSTIGINQMTAYLLMEYGSLEKGDWIAQTAGNSAVAASVNALARQRGIRTLNIVRRPEAVGLVDEAADTVLVDDADLASNTETELDGATLPLILAATGGPATTTLMGFLRERGTVVAYAALDNKFLTPPNVIYLGLNLHGFWVINWIRDTPREQVAKTYRRVAELVVDGTLRTPVAATYPLAEYRAAIAHASGSGPGERRGKVFLTFPR